MDNIGQKERKTQQRVVKLFRETLGYGYLGNWEVREGNRNIEPKYLRAWLKVQGHADALIGKALTVCRDSGLCRSLHCLSAFSPSAASSRFS